MPTAEQICEPDAVHGEGPVWSPEWGGLRFVDLLAGDVLHLNEMDGRTHRWNVGKVAAALRPRTGGGALIATEREFVVAQVAGGPVRTLTEAFEDTGIRFNDGACDPAGNFLCGTMAYDETTGAGTVYRLLTDGRVEVVLDNVTVSNGLDWTSDGRTALYVDTPTHRIDAFDSDERGNLSGRRTFAAIDESLGSPDGLTVDSEGGVWVAMWAGGAVLHYDPAGHLAEVIDLPVPKVTACTFGGPELTDLYITTSRNGEAPNENPGAGAVFRYHTDVAGLPVRPFAG